MLADLQAAGVPSSAIDRADHGCSSAFASPSSIEQGVAIPISVVSAAGTNTVFVDAKLNLTVKPHVTNEGSVIMNLHISRNEPDFVNTGARGDPNNFNNALAITPFNTAPTTCPGSRSPRPTSSATRS